MCPNRTRTLRWCPLFAALPWLLACETRGLLDSTRHDSADPVVANYGGRQLTLAEVDRRAGVDLEQQRRSALAQMVDEDLLRMEAARRGITPQQLIHDEIESKVALPTQDEISAAYQQILSDKQIPPDTSFEQYRAALLENRRRQGEDALRRAFLAALRKGANLELKIPAPDARDVAGREGDTTLDRQDRSAPPARAPQSTVTPPTGHGAAAERPTFSAPANTPAPQPHP